jgi:hypothetical protein
LLDCYLFNETSSVEEPDESAYIGSLSLEEHDVLKAVWSCADSSHVKLPFFADTQLPYDSVETLKSCLSTVAKHRGHSDESFKQAAVRLSCILDCAMQKQSGIIAFCD